MLQFIKILFYNSGIHGGLQLFQSCIPIVVSGCCSLASSRSGGANSSHSRLHLLQGSSKHRLHAILVPFVSTRPKILCILSQLMLEVRSPFLSDLTILATASLTLFVLSLVVIVVLSHCGKPLLQHCRPSAWLGGGASTESTGCLTASTIYFCTKGCV